MTSSATCSFSEGTKYKEMSEKLANGNHCISSVCLVKKNLKYHFKKMACLVLFVFLFKSERMRLYLNIKTVYGNGLKLPQFVAIF